MIQGIARISGALLLLIGAACARQQVQVAPPPSGFDRSGQLIVVTTPDWNATTGVLRRFTRELPGGNWQPVGASVQIVVGRTGLAWGDAALATAGEPVKHEGDGKSPAGVFPLDTAFGFAPRDSMMALRLPYVQLQLGSDCVDDEQSSYYNTVVDRARVPRVDWNSAEHMRQISVYRIGVIVGYNAAPPVRGRGSCIFLHIWSGPASVTAGCTAMDAAALDGLMRWLDRDRRPVIVQLPEREYARIAREWALPAR
jgi:D-alanyl-D-alanine dipeptidase